MELLNSGYDHAIRFLVPKHQRATFDRAVAALPPGFLDFPATGESFDSKASCKARLQGFALGQGFAVVIGKSNKDSTPKVEFLCIHHGCASRNDRGLEEEVQKDSSGAITSKRQRGNTQMMQKLDCGWRCICSYKYPYPGAVERIWQLTMTCSSHTHAMRNPFAYQAHVHATTEYQVLVAKARHMRMTFISYSDSKRVLQMEGLGLTIDSTTYYNTVRHNRPSSEDCQTIQGLLVALADSGFVWRCRVEVEEDSEGNIISQKLVQIFFIHPKQIYLAQRFVAGFVMVIDGTFNTNVLRLPLLISVGITNSGKTFPTGFSYCPSESTESYQFFFQSMKETAFVGEIQLPRVIVGDQAGGLIAAIDSPSPKPFPGVRLQHCNWHAVEAMKAKYRKSGYKSDEVEELAHFSWLYVNGDTEEELESNRTALLLLLKAPEKAYIEDTWMPKEWRTIRCHTKLFANLGVNANQRSESYHVPMREITSGLLSLEESAKRLTQTCLQRLEMLELDEVQPGVKTLRILTSDRWSFLIGSVSKLALMKVKEEWAKLPAFESEVTNTDIIDCSCELLLRYGLPCKHHLLQAYRTGQPIPRSLLHPRWWLDGPVIKTGKWIPIYGQEQTLVLSPKENDLAGAALELIEARDALGPEAQSRLDSIFLQSTSTMLQAAQRNEALAQLPIGIPDAIPKKAWRKKKTHGPAGAAGLTSAEMARRDLLAKEKAEGAANRAANHASESVDEEDPGLLPPSTAPPRLEESGCMKRTRGRTMDFVALHTGTASKKGKP